MTPNHYGVRLVSFRMVAKFLLAPGDLDVGPIHRLVVVQGLPATKKYL